MAPACYRIDSPSVIFEKFGDELVAIHLDTGSYHSLMGAAADAFVLLAEEATATELAEALTSKYQGNAEDIGKELGPFLAALEKEKLIARVEIRKPRGPLVLEAGQTKLPFVPPSLEAYHDLQSLFLLDPVHEVGDRGWPEPLAGAQPPDAAQPMDN